METVHTLHIFSPPTIRLPKWATHERFANCAADRRVFTNCCCCWVPASETTVQIVCAPPIPHGMTDDEAMEYISENAAYYMDDQQIIECGPGFGCIANPRRKIGSLRGADGARDVGLPKVGGFVHRRSACVMEVRLMGGASVLACKVCRGTDTCRDELEDALQCLDKRRAPPAQLIPPRHAGLALENSKPHNCTPCLSNGRL